jgi:hypothetical protein
MRGVEIRKRVMAVGCSEFNKAVIGQAHSKEPRAIGYRPQGSVLLNSGPLIRTSPPQGHLTSFL